MKHIARQFKQSLRNTSVSSLFGQTLMLGLIFYAAYYLLMTTQANLTARGIESGFDFLNVEAGLPIGDALIDYNPTKSYGYAFFVGILNTLFVSFVAIIFASILGIIVGVGRTSKNWIISRVSAVYVQTLRNVPLLLVLFFIYTVVLATLPRAKNPYNPIEGVFLSRRGLYLPDPIAQDGFGFVALSLLIAIGVAYFFSRWAKKLQIRTGKALPKALISIAIIFLLPIAVFLALGSPMTLEYAELKGFNFVGGITLKPEFSALLLGLILYTAAYIGENVRSGLESVSAGQIEAANALGVPQSVIIKNV